MNRRLAFVMLLLAACEKVPSVPAATEPHTFRASTDVWSGSAVTITSAGFASVATLPIVLLDGLAISTRRIDDTTLAAAVPDAPGAHSLRLGTSGFDQRPVAVYLHGFVSHETGPELSGRIEPGVDPRYVFGSGPLSLRRWNIASNKSIDLGDTVHAVSCTGGVGPGPDVGEIVVLTGGCASRRWSVWHTEPLYQTSDTAAAITQRVVAILSTGLSVVLGRDTIFVNACSGGTCSTVLVPGTEGRDVVRSPRGDRAALLTRLLTTPGIGGAPVVDVTQGAIAYRIAALSEARGAGFSSGGDTLYVAGRTDTPGAFRLAAVRAADGMPLTSRVLDFEPCTLAVDPGGAWLYVAGLNAAGQSRLQVFDRVSLDVITTLRVSAAATFGGDSHRCRIMPNPVGHLLYLVDTQAEHDPAARAQLFSFETPR